MYVHICFLSEAFFNMQVRAFNLHKHINDSANIKIHSGTDILYSLVFIIKNSQFSFLNLLKLFLHYTINQLTCWHNIARLFGNRKRYYSKISENCIFKDHKDIDTFNL